VCVRRAMLFACSTSSAAICGIAGTGPRDVTTGPAAALFRSREPSADLEKSGKDRDIKFVRSLTIQDVRESRASWKDGAISAHK
jgi:hypothetical protein